MRVTIAQLCVERAVARNKEKILAVARAAQPDDWVVFPEGALSGYFPEEDGFLRDLDPEELDEAIREVGRQAAHSRCYCVLGAAIRTNGVWHNAVVIQSPLDSPFTYRKIELSRLDKRHFTPGVDLPVHSTSGVTVGVQMCRELIFPEPWTTLRRKGAQVILHINNAIKPHDQVWKHILISRAIENALFVCSVNNAAAPQELTSYLIAPSGQILLEAGRQVEQTLSQEIDLGAVTSSLAGRTDF